MAHPSRVFLDEIAGAVAISAAQSAAVVSQVAARLERWIAAKDPPHLVIPSLADLAVHRGGHLWWHRGRVVPQRDAVGAIGELLEALLRQGPGGRAPAGLLYVVARATDPRHLAPFVSLQELRGAVGRHAPAHASFAIDALLAEYLMATSGCKPLGDESTISDVRRLRRAGGVSLPRISEDTGIPLSLLRELEWGVFTNWDPSYASGSLEAYAGRAGLDAAKVAAIVRRERAAEQVSLVRVERASPPVPLREPRGHGVAPFALAATLLAAVVVTAPADRHAKPSAFAGPPPAPAPVSLRPVPATPVSDDPVRSVVAPASNIATTPTTPPVRPRSRTAPRRPSNRAAGATTRGSARTVQPPRHAFTRFAHALAGDGRHKVEPFPKVQR